MSDDFRIRFRGVERLYGVGSTSRLREAHVAVVGLGGVGSWVVEALARSGVGRFTLIDLDEVCLSNVNRQLPALDGAVGRFKAELLGERIRAIQPTAEVRLHVEFFTETSSDRLLGASFDAVVDAIDAISNKCRLIARCRDRSLPVVTCGGAGARRDPTRLRIVDLADATHDRLLSEVRRRLRREWGFPPTGCRLGVPCVVSDEIPARSREEPSCYSDLAGKELKDGEPESDSGEGRRLTCEGGLGSAAFVTGAFGFAAASWVVETILGRARRPEAAGVHGPA